MVSKQRPVLGWTRQSSQLGMGSSLPGSGKWVLLPQYSGQQDGSNTESMLCCSSVPISAFNCSRMLLGALAAALALPSTVGHLDAATTSSRLSKSLLQHSSHHLGDHLPGGVPLATSHHRSGKKGHGEDTAQCLFAHGRNFGSWNIHAGFSLRQKAEGFII